MRKDAIDERGVDADDDQRDPAGKGKSERDGNSLMDSVGVLQGVVLKREMLMERLNAI